MLNSEMKVKKTLYKSNAANSISAVTRHKPCSLRDCEIQISIDT